MKKQVEISEVNFGSIIPNLIYVIFERQDKENENGEPKVKTLQTFQELRKCVTEGIEMGSNLKLEIHFVEDNDITKGKIVKKKNGFKLSFASLNKIVSKVKKATNYVSIDDLKKNPNLVSSKNEFENLQKKLKNFEKNEKFEKKHKKNLFKIFSSINFKSSSLQKRTKSI